MGHDWHRRRLDHHLPIRSHTALLAYSVKDQSELGRIPPWCASTSERVHRYGNCCWIVEVDHAVDLAAVLTVCLRSAGRGRGLHLRHDSFLRQPTSCVVGSLHKPSGKGESGLNGWELRRRGHSHRNRKLPIPRFEPSLFRNLLG